MTARGARGADLALAGVALIWGTTFVLVKNALAEVSPVLFLGLRFTLAAVVLAAIYRRRWSAAAVRAGCLVGFFLFAGYAFQTVGLRLTTPAKSAFITGLYVVMVPLLAAAVYRIRPRRAEVAGVACAMSGMAVLTLESGWGAVNRGDLLTVACAAAFAAHIVLLGHYSREIAFEVLSVLQIAVSGGLAMVTFWWMETPIFRWSPTVAAAVVVTGLLATALAFTVQAWAQQHTTPTRTALIFALEPVFAWVTSYVWTGETLSARAGLGAAAILGGILLVELKPAENAQHQSQ